MTALYLVDPAPSPRWSPFAECRPIAELRSGAWLVRERWEALADGRTEAIFGPAHLHSFVEDGAPPVRARHGVEGPALVGRSEFAPAGVRPEYPRDPARLVNDGTTVGWWVPDGCRWEGDADDWPELPIEGMLLHGAFDLITALEHFLPADAADFTHEHGDPVPDGSVVIGDPADVILLGAAVEPGVTFDVRRGAVVLEQHVYVRAGTRLEGPCYCGPGCELLGGDIAMSAFGPRCKMRGEVRHTVALGYANKAHEGFVGHSVIGRWVNLGAGTTTSNLKNTYGPVRLRTGGEVVETERANLGTLFGDHVKVAIGTLFDTGTVVGAGANVFGALRPPKDVRPFAWGVDGATIDRDGFLRIATRVMPRRGVEVTEAVRAALTAIYDRGVSA